MFTLLSANIATCHMPLEIYPPTFIICKQGCI